MDKFGYILQTNHFLINSYQIQYYQIYYCWITLIFVLSVSIYCCNLFHLCYRIYCSIYTSYIFYNTIISFKHLLAFLYLVSDWKTKWQDFHYECYW